MILPPKGFDGTMFERIPFAGSITGQPHNMKVMLTQMLLEISASLEANNPVRHPSNCNINNILRSRY
ncbi:hypothetical protein CDAR_107521 [Caerostris darwini]|uniref:Uncharacterized protein n=1 Tax=Caerostris darwini TaxID=1538125 RepID=A0AAV4RP97_9ARAC|nr:hypothetical protein CDAR_107521 [Caerostris darwini]